MRYDPGMNVYYEASETKVFTWNNLQYSEMLAGACFLSDKKIAQYHTI
jgi:hypothetical protein